MKPGLGRGLDSLLKAYDEEEPKIRTNNIGEKDGETYKIDINKIYTNPNQPRKTFDSESLNELAESISIGGGIYDY